jgi:DNA helicase IV
VGTFVLSCGLRDGWELYAPGHPTPIALAGPAIDNNAVPAAQRWAEAVILREGHRVVSWADGFDPHEEGYVPVLAEPLPVEEPDSGAPADDPYLHVILDEAQDLSPMQYRAVGRRCALSSATVLGDIAQGTTPWATEGWDTALDHLGKPDGRVQELTAGYRVPRQIIEFASRLLPHVAPGLAAATSVRQATGALELRTGRGSAREFGTQLVATCRAALDQPGSVGVICADSRAGAVAKGLRSGGLEPEIAGADGLTARLSVVPATLAKGLEFDHVIVVEPAEIVASESRGLRRLYVVLTRAVTTLTVLHTQPLPAELAA